MGSGVYECNGVNWIFLTGWVEDRHCRRSSLNGVHFVNYGTDGAASSSMAQSTFLPSPSYKFAMKPLLDTDVLGSVPFLLSPLIIILFPSSSLSSCGTFSTGPTEVVYGASVAYVVVDYFTFNSLRLGRAAQSVVGRLIHFWDSRNINKNEEFMGIMILLDELVRIVSILFMFFSFRHYRNDLKDGSIVRLDRFVVARVAEHQFVAALSNSFFLMLLVDLATGCYAHACGRFPNNLELMMGLFNCYVREYSFMKQQQTAIKMYKLAGEERFLLWAVCSIKLQVLCDRSGEKLLLLPEGLLKLIASHITVSRLNPLTVCAGANCIQF
uniref:Uncharacterized protein n=1 Tax=Brassica oleracea var. oleracea TaxID=109376 RepID=A0A0D3A502_BRAOL